MTRKTTRLRKVVACTTENSLLTLATSLTSVSLLSENGVAPFYLSWKNTQQPCPDFDGTVYELALFLGKRQQRRLFSTFDPPSPSGVASILIRVRPGSRRALLPTQQ